MGKVWYNVVRHYTSAGSHLTGRRIITRANCAYPLEGGQFHWQIMCTPRLGAGDYVLFSYGCCS